MERTDARSSFARWMLRFAWRTLNSSLSLSYPRTHTQAKAKMKTHQPIDKKKKNHKKTTTRVARRLRTCSISFTATLKSLYFAAYLASSAPAAMPDAYGLLRWPRPPPAPAPAEEEAGAMPTTNSGGAAAPFPFPLLLLFPLLVVGLAVGLALVEELVVVVLVVVLPGPTPLPLRGPGEGWRDILRVCPFQRGFSVVVVVDRLEWFGPSGGFRCF